MLRAWHSGVPPGYYETVPEHMPTRVHLRVKCPLVCRAGRTAACLQALGFVSHETGICAQFIRAHIPVRADMDKST